MITNILETLRQSVNDANPGVFQNSFAGSYQLDNGKVVVVDYQNEMQQVALADNLGNYFYLRTFGDAGISDTADRLTACNNKQFTFGARAVFVIKRGKLDLMLDTLVGDIVGNKGTIGNATNVRCEPTGAITNFEEIFTQETQKPPRKMPNATLLLIDFDISFNWGPPQGDCLSRNFCDPC